MEDMFDGLMASSYDPADPAGNNCSDGSLWIHHHFKQCVGNPVEYLGFMFSWTAMGLWLAAHIMLFGARQREANPTRREFILILHMCAANVFNLVGATLSQQLGTQVLTASYLVITDVIFICHFAYMWYAFRPHPQGEHEFQYSEWKSPGRVRDRENGDTAQLAVLLLPWIPSLIYLPGFLKSANTNSQSANGMGRNLLMVTDSPSDNFGYAIGFFSAMLYCAVLIPRVLDGLHRKAYLHRRFRVHFFCILANIFYILSIIMYDQNPVFIINELPWLLGSMASVFLDTAIVYLIVFRENQVAKERKVEARLARVSNINTIDDEILRHREDGSQVERTRLDEDALEDHTEWAMAEAMDSKRLSLILEIDEPEDIIMEQKPPRPKKNDIIPEYVPPSAATGPGIDDSDDTMTSDDGMDHGDDADSDAYTFERVGKRPTHVTKFGDDFGDDMEWDFADISQQYEDDDELKWHTAKSNAAPQGWDDDDRILQEVDAELYDGGSDVASLDFEDEMGLERAVNELWYDPETEVTSN